MSASIAARMFRARRRTVAKHLSAAGEVRNLEVDLDVADDTNVEAAVAALERDPGRLDVLINNAAA